MGITYRPGKGFTGFILSEVRSIRLRNARDPEEILSRVGADLLESRGIEASHPEALADSGVPWRLLAVPMRSATRPEPPEDEALPERESLQARGVIRILRKEEDPPFTAAEQAALQHFADVLGLAIRSAWRLFLAESIMESGD